MSVRIASTVALMVAAIAASCLSVVSTGCRVVAIEKTVTETGLDEFSNVVSVVETKLKASCHTYLMTSSFDSMDVGISTNGVWTFVLKRYAEDVSAQNAEIIEAAGDAAGNVAADVINAVK